MGRDQYQASRGATAIILASSLRRKRRRFGVGSFGFLGLANRSLRRLAPGSAGSLRGRRGVGFSSDAQHADRCIARWRHHRGRRPLGRPAGHLPRVASRVWPGGFAMSQVASRARQSPCGERELGAKFKRLAALKSNALTPIPSGQPHSERTKVKGARLRSHVT